MFAALPASAALVVPGHSIGKVVLGQSVGTVRHELGKPSSVTVDIPGPCGQSRNCAEHWDYKKLQLTVDFGRPFPNTSPVLPETREVVDEVTTDNVADHTAKGIRVGSSIRQAKAAYPKMHCQQTSFLFCYTFGPDSHHWTLFDNNGISYDTLLLGLSVGAGGLP